MHISSIPRRRQGCRPLCLAGLLLGTMALPVWGQVAEPTASAWMQEWHVLQQHWQQRQTFINQADSLEQASDSLMAADAELNRSLVSLGLQLNQLMQIREANLYLPRLQAMQSSMRQQRQHRFVEARHWMQLGLMASIGTATHALYVNQRYRHILPEHDLVRYALQNSLDLEDVREFMALMQPEQLARMDVIIREHAQQLSEALSVLKPALLQQRQHWLETTSTILQRPLSEQELGMLLDKVDASTPWRTQLAKRLELPSSHPFIKEVMSDGLDAAFMQAQHENDGAVLVKALQTRLAGIRQQLNRTAELRLQLKLLTARPPVTQFGNSLRQLVNDSATLLQQLPAAQWTTEAQMAALKTATQQHRYLQQILETTPGRLFMSHGLLIAAEAIVATACIWASLRIDNDPQPEVTAQVKTAWKKLQQLDAFGKGDDSLTRVELEFQKGWENYQELLQEAKLRQLPAAALQLPAMMQFQE